MQLLWWTVSAPWGWLFSAVLVAVHVAVIIRALTRPGRTASARVAWVAVLLFLPLLGVLAYFFLGETSIGRIRTSRMTKAEAALAPPEATRVTALEPAIASVFSATESINGFAVTEGNTVRLSADSDTAINELVADIDAARSTIHIGFYIWLADENGTKVAQAVMRAAQRGVTCRILVDALGSRAFIASPLWAQMKGSGAHCVAALRDLPRWGKLAVGRVDLRNHRKITVIDDTIGYCGSQNCADPAFRVKAKFAPWVDVFFRVQGPIVAQQQWLFLTTWRTELPHDTVDVGSPRAWGGHEGAASAAGPESEPTFGAMFGTGPTVRAGAMSEAFTTVIGAANHELIMSTPYFVPDESLLAALCAAPRKGVRTTLVIPRRNDSWFVAQAARSSYLRLLEAGVQLYEYPLGLLHSKTITVDGQLALVGSANMDRRSLELNFENNLLLANPAVTATVRERQQSYLEASTPVSVADVKAWSLWARLVQNTVAMLAPIL